MQAPSIKRRNPGWAGRRNWLELCVFVASLARRVALYSNLTVEQAVIFKRFNAMLISKSKVSNCVVLYTAAVIPLPVCGLDYLCGAHAARDRLLLVE